MYLLNFLGKSPTALIPMELDVPEGTYSFGAAPDHIRDTFSRTLEARRTIGQLELNAEFCTSIEAKAEATAELERMRPLEVIMEIVQFSQVAEFYHINPMSVVFDSNWNAREIKLADPVLVHYGNLYRGLGIDFGQMIISLANDDEPTSPDQNAPSGMKCIGELPIELRGLYSAYDAQARKFRERIMRLNHDGTDTDHALIHQEFEQEALKFQFLSQVLSFEVTLAVPDFGDRVIVDRCWKIWKEGDEHAQSMISRMLAHILGQR